MKKFYSVIALITITFSSVIIAQDKKYLDKYPTDPTRLEGWIKKFEEKDKIAPPPEGAIVCTGSSSMGGWQRLVEVDSVKIPAIQRDLAPLTVIPRAFGGSTFDDLLYFADRDIIKYKPRAVLIYEGDNDTYHRVDPEVIFKTFKELITKLHNNLPECRIYVMSSKPSISRWKIWEDMKILNKMLENECNNDSLLTYIDITEPMFGNDGMPLKEIFGKDNLHMNEKGYEIWTKEVRKIMMEKEIVYE